MPEHGAPTVLVDGPNVGQFVHTDPCASAYYVAKRYEPLAWSPSFDWTASTMVLPEPTVYRLDYRTACLKVRNSPAPAYVRLRIGWSEGDSPNEDAINRYGRAALAEHPELMPYGAVLWPADPAHDEPIRIVEAGDGPCPGCQDVFEMHPRTRLMRGTCPCGWRTEEVELRRFEELCALTGEHGRAGYEALTELLQRGVYSYAEYAALTGIVLGGDPGGAARRLAATERQPERDAVAGQLDWGEPLAAAYSNWPTDDSATCAHVCGGDPDHQCDARATTHLTYDLPSGGRRRMPMCGPCFASETAAKEHVDA